MKSNQIRIILPFSTLLSETSTHQTSVQICFVSSAQTLCALLDTKLTARLQAKPSFSAKIVLPKHTGEKDVKNQILAGCSVLGRIFYLW